ncbi:hypothetical protein DXA57_10035 [Blautia sp. OF03-15BH]|nr:hypothetical protein DXA57_10035 [Blautia sp. OF03-15BH]
MTPSECRTLYGRKILNQKNSAQTTVILPVQSFLFSTTIDILPRLSETRQILPSGAFPHTVLILCG